MTEEEQDVGHVPHYPNWRYYCPRCQQFWESEIRRPNFLQECPDCVMKEVRSGKM